MSVTFGASLDDLLGRAEDRYFALGHRAVVYGLQLDHPLDLQGVEPVRFDAMARYPDGWSRNTDGASRVPHLSSVDAIALSAMTAQGFGAAIDACSHHWVRGIELRSGSKPWFDLSCIPITMHVDNSLDAFSTVTALVGNIRTTLHLSTGDVLPLSFVGGGTVCSCDDAWSVYPNGDRRNSSQSTIMSLDREQAILKASHEFIAEVDPAWRRPGGLEASFWPALTVIDYLVTMGQLTQALVYAVSGLDRSRMSNLWMRTMRIHSINRPLPVPARIDTATRLIRDVVIDRGNGRVHNLTVSSDASNGVTAKATLAYTEIGGI